MSNSISNQPKFVSTWSIKEETEKRKRREDLIYATMTPPCRINGPRKEVLWALIAVSSVIIIGLSFKTPHQS